MKYSHCLKNVIFKEYCEEEKCHNRAEKGTYLIVTFLLGLRPIYASASQLPQW